MPLSGVDFERFHDLVDHLGPGVAEHAARRVDDEDDVFAVDWDPADQVGTRAVALAIEAAHLGVEPLCRAQFAEQLGLAAASPSRRAARCSSARRAVSRRSSSATAAAPSAACASSSVAGARGALRREQLALQPRNGVVARIGDGLERRWIAEARDHQQRMIAPKPHVMTSRNAMLIGSKPRRTRFTASRSPG